MKSHAQAVVIGGGAIGASVLYHLIKAGWKDVVLLERDTLTCGSTWHAAGGFHTLNGDPNVARLQAYTVGLYKELEEISGENCGLHLTGGLALVDYEDRLDWLKMSHARGRYLGMDTEIISVEEAHELLPLIDPQYLVGAMWDPVEGHLDSYGTTMAYAKSARIGAAEIEQSCKVEALDWDAGDLHAPGTRRDAARHLRARRGRRRQRRGTSGRSCWSRTSTARRFRWRSASSTFRPSSARVSGRSSTAPSPSRPTATRSSEPSTAYRTSGVPAP